MPSLGCLLWHIKILNKMLKAYIKKTILMLLTFEEKQTVNRMLVEPLVYKTRSLVS